MPMVGNVDTATDPHVVKALDIIQESCQGRGTARLAYQAAMQAHGHHLGAAVQSFLTQVVERIL